ncbi:MAG TPA: ATP-binding protein [Acidimicrobiales bacterium]
MTSLSASAERGSERAPLGAEFTRALLALDDLRHDGPGRLLTELRDALPATVGFRVVGMRIATEHGVLEAGALAGSTFERRLWRRWRRRRTRPALAEDGGAVYAPAWGGGRVNAIVRAQPVCDGMSRHEQDILQSLAMAIGHTLGHQQLHRTVERRERELAFAEERARVAWDLHETVAGFLRAIETTAGHLAEATAADAHEDARLIATLSRSGRRELEAVVRMAEPLAFDPRGLDQTVRRAVEAAGQLLGTAADLRVAGTPRPLSMEVQQLLLRVVFEVLHRVGRHSRSTGAVVRLEFTDTSAAIVVRDDGVDLATRESTDGRPDAHFGLRVVRRRVEAVGGSMIVEHRPPRGLYVRAEVPA